MRRESPLLVLIKDMSKYMPLLLWVMAVVTNNSAIVFSIVSINNCIASGNLPNLLLLKTYPCATCAKIDRRLIDLALQYESDSHPAGVFLALTNQWCMPV